MADDDLRPHRILVTGASGFIGRPLCRALVREGADVHGTTRRHRPELDDAVTWHVADLTDPEATEAVVSKTAPDLVYHLAGQVTGVRDVDHMLDVFHNTLTSTVHVLLAAHRSRVRRVVLTSSMEEPDAADGLAIPASPYAAAKWAAGGYGRMFATFYGVEVVELRVFMTYGPGPQNPHKLVPAVILALLAGKRPRLGSGARRVDWVHVDDVVRALLLAADANIHPGQRPDVGSGTALPLRAFVEQLAHHVSPEAELHFDTDLDRKAEREPVADLATARRLLGWEPRIGLDEGLAGVVDWYRERYEAGDFDDG